MCRSELAARRHHIKYNQHLTKCVVEYKGHVAGERMHRRNAHARRAPTTSRGSVACVAAAGGLAVSVEPATGAPGAVCIPPCAALPPGPSACITPTVVTRAAETAPAELGRTSEG